MERCNSCQTRDFCRCTTVEIAAADVLDARRVQSHEELWLDHVQAREASADAMGQSVHDVARNAAEYVGLAWLRATLSMLDMLRKS